MEVESINISQPTEGVSTHPVLVKADALAYFIIRQDHRRCPNCHTLLQTFESLTDALQFCGDQGPRISDCAEAQLGQVLGGQILRLPALND